MPAPCGQRQRYAAKMKLGGAHTSNIRLVGVSDGIVKPSGEGHPSG